MQQQEQSYYFTSLVPLRAQLQWLDGQIQAHQEMIRYATHGSEDYRVAMGNYKVLNALRENIADTLQNQHLLHRTVHSN